MNERLIMIGLIHGLDPPEEGGLKGRAATGT